MPRYAPRVAAIAVIALTIGAPASLAGVKPHLIWRDGPVGVPGLDAFKKVDASAWDIDPARAQAEQPAPDPQLLEKGRSLRTDEPGAAGKNDWF